MEIEVCCPKCEWIPDGGAHWQCTCGCVWNTFETAGKCPTCTRSWEDTMCPGPHSPGGCGQWSKHVDWYRNLDENFKEELEKSFKEISVK